LDSISIRNYVPSGYLTIVLLGVTGPPLLYQDPTGHML